MRFRPVLLLLALLAVPCAASGQAGLAPFDATYAAQAERQGGVIDIGRRRITVSDTTIDGRRGWVVVRRTLLGTSAPPADSVTMTADLRQVARRTVLGATRIVLDVRGDSVTGWQTVPGGRQPISLPLAEGGFLDADALRVALAAWPLGPGWRRAAAALALGGGGQFAPRALAVEGEERITVPAGTFDCWVVAVADGGSVFERDWVSKDRQLVIRSREQVGAESVVQMELESLGPPP